MSSETEREWGWKEILPATVGGILLLMQIPLCFFFYNLMNMDAVLCVGWAFLVIGIVLTTLPRSTLKGKGDVSEGKSWVYTTKLVDTGVYGVVRHPIYVGWMVMAVALALISQYWISAVFALIQIPIVYHDIRKEDRTNIEKFGTDYNDYQNRVPMVNFVVGFVRFLQRRRQKY